MDAWEQLISGSTIQNGDAWEHLLAQGGTGTGTIDYVVLADGMEVSMSDQCLEVSIDNQVMEVSIDQGTIEIEIEDKEMTVEICNGE